MSITLDELRKRLGIAETETRTVTAGAIELPSPSFSLQETVIQRQRELAIREWERLNRAGADYGGLETLRKIMRRAGR
jgi:hypothetical protein